MAKQITIDKVPGNWIAGRYVCDHKCTEVHLFNNGDQAKAFAKQWDRDCNIGWLSPVYDKGRNRKPTAAEAQQQTANSAHVFDHRFTQENPHGPTKSSA